MSNQSLAGLLARRITELGISQRKYAERIGTSQTWVNQVLQGRIALPSADVRRRLAKDLGISHLDLLIAAGEITREEALEAGVEPRDPLDGVPDEVVKALREVEWDSLATSSILSSIRFGIPFMQKAQREHS